MPEAVLALEGLTAGYDEAAVIRDLDVIVGPGEVVALLGANGAGKTTTLRAVSGLVKPMDGRVLFEGEDLVRSSPSARARGGIAHVPEGRGLFYGLTVAEHFRLAPRNERLDEALAYEYFPKLAELQKRRVGLLSGGEQQMLAVARILRTGARLLLLDEISEGLAPVIVQKLGAVVKSLREQGYTIVMVEQNFRFAAPLADRFLVMEHGQVIQQFTQAELPARMERLHEYLGV